MLHAAVAGAVLMHDPWSADAVSGRVHVSAASPRTPTQPGLREKAEPFDPSSDAPPPDMPLVDRSQLAEPIPYLPTAWADSVPALVPAAPVPPLTNRELLPPAATVLVSVRAVRPPTPVMVMPPVVLSPPEALLEPLAQPSIEAPPPARPDAAPNGATPIGAAPSEVEVLAPVPDARNAPPRYPTLSRRLAEQGEVIVRALVSEDGRVLEAEVLTSSGHPRLDQAALSAVRGWTFAPALRAGRPVVHPLEIPVLFELQG